MMTQRARSLKAVLCILAAAIVFFLPSLSRSERAEEPVVITVPGITVTVKDGSTGDPAAGYIMRQMTGVGAPPTKGASGFSKLEGNDARLYTALKPLIAEVAAGERGSTVFEIPVTEIYEKIYYTFEELGAVDGDAAQAAFQDRIAFDIGKVNSALLVDCPYELYWYDKTSGIGTLGYGYSMSSNAVFFSEETTIPIYLYVSAEYSASGSSGTFDMDTSWGTSVQAAASTARGIVTANAGLGDIAKLKVYKDAICGRVDYNFDALAAGTLYGNPWQLVWVFDNDPTTKVVCEGYSKAFQFLCDESSFSGNIVSIIVTGTMQGGTGAGGHMWNVVTLDNGRKYLADVTNSDAGSVGQDGGLFLDGYTTKEALSDGRVAYTYEIGSQSITYWYDSKIIDLYGPDDLSLPEIIDQGTLDGGIAWALDDNGLLTLEGTGEAAVASADAQPWYSYRSGITSVHVSEGITALGNDLFHGLNALESVDLPSGLESIGAYTFDNCASLQTVDLPADLTSIGDHAFAGCSALTSLTILYRDMEFGDGAFDQCTGMTLRGYACSTAAVYAVANDISFEVIPGGDHIWGEPEYTWADDNTSVTASVMCERCGYEESETVETTSVITKEPGCETMGETTYTAEFTVPDFETQTRTVPDIEPAGHSLTGTAAKAATCTEAGNTAYWTCEICGKYFSDENGTAEIEEDSWVISALGHSLTGTAAKTATCTEAGNTAYWTCEVCGKYFSDAEGTAEIEEDSWVITAGHALTGTAAKAATCTETGNTAYWTCEVCGKYFSDAQGDTEIEEGSWVIPPLGAPVLTVSDVGSSYDYNDVVELRADVTCPSASDEELLDRYPDARITASLITADGDTVSGFIVQSVSGLEASFRFPLGDDGMVPGYYKIRVETNVEGLAADSASFYYTAEKNDLPDPADCRVKLTLNTTIFGLNERFRLTARVINTAGEPVQGIRVGFQVLDLNGDITDFYTGYSYLYNTTNGEGTCSITSTLSEEEIFPAGNYVARVFILEGDSSDSLPFEFVRADHSTHQYVKVEGTAPTCTDAGTETYWKCSVCRLLFSAQNENAQISAPATIPARGHTPVTDPAVAATTTSAGLTEGSHCSVCGTVLVAQQVIPKIDEPAIAVIDASTFPDKAFLAWVSANVDTNKDGKLTKTEIASVKSADLSAVKTIEKLNGIELFTSLETLDVSDNKLTELDVSKLTELKTLKADNDQLTGLDLSGNTKLTAFSCAGNAYTVKVKAGVIDLSVLKGFDVTKASAFSTGKVSGTTLTVLKPGDVTYTYDCGGNFKAVFTLRVTADPVDVTKVTAKKDKYPYTGKAIEPVLTVTATVDGREITLDKTQYEAEFKDNVKAGKATVKVTGTGFFKGSVETTFEITKVKLASATLKYTKTVYTGKALKPTAAVKAKVGGKTVTLKSGTDYSLTYKNNVNAGKATVTIKGKGNFTGTLTKTFTITGAPITSAKVKNASLPYNGKAKTPILIVKGKVGTKTVTLVKNRDYTAEYTNNKNAGTATVTVKGKGNFSGTVTCTFRINPLKLSTGKATLSDTTLKYTGKALKPKVTVTVKVGTKTVTLTQGTDFTVKYLNNKKPGTATVTVKGKGNFTGTVKLTFDIVKK